LVAKTKKAASWTWDGEGWEKKKPADSPPARHAASLVYDAERGVSVLFGGFGPAKTVRNDTWTWNGDTWRLRDVTTRPAARRHAAMAYDGANGVVLLFGGATQEDVGGTDDTWAWNGKVWTEQRPSTIPEARRLAAMAYDRARKRILLFGGDNPSGEPLGDTWLWDGSDWLRVDSAETFHPPNRYCSAMAYDPERDGVVLFGGTGESGLLGDSWLWDGAAWAELRPLRSPRKSEATQRLVWEAKAKSVFLYGGGVFGEVNEEAWRLTPTRSR
jgi:hypothetical protein